VAAGGPGLTVKIFAAAGGSGGHCYPAIAFLQACKNRHPDWPLTLVVDRGAKTLGLEVEASAASAIIEIESAKFAGAKSLFKPEFWRKLFRGTRQARELLKREKPDLVVGFGGYGSFPCVWEAASLKVPVVVHEQNADLGTANRVLSRRAAKIAVSLPLAGPGQGKVAAVQGTPDGRAGKVVRTGFPLRTTLNRMDPAAVRRRFELDPAKKTLLVFGGSQGSRFINQLIDDCMERYGRELGDAWQVLHLTGRAPAGTQPRHDVLTGPYRRWAYSREMDALYAAADLVACRAGSATLHELSYFGKPSILIPYPHARGHQLHNARALADGGAAWIFEEKTASPAAFKALLDRAAADPALLEEMGRRSLALLKTDGAEALVDLAESFA
jgi:UDP-N-acetylglucosamine--N-acetylmuramyl-(pentapeptide) pyrophosphoryl-undecaprenol N-acetylglucosamine transferase